MRIVFDHVTSIYHAGTSREQLALDDICVDVDSHRIIGICGMTGSGKSTFIRQLNGILTPHSGRIRIDDQDIHQSKDTLRHIRQRIGMTFQFPERQLFGRTVWEELSYTLEKHVLPESEIEQRILSVSHALNFDIQTLRHCSPFLLSRGDQRKLGIAVILTLQPELLVLDEPTAGMDRVNAYHLLDLLLTLHQRRDYQIVIVSHDLELLLKYAEHLIVLHHGKILLTEAKEQIINNAEMLQSTGFSLSPVYKTLYLLHQTNPKVHTTVSSVDEAIKEVLIHVSLSSR